MEKDAWRNENLMLFEDLDHGEVHYEKSMEMATSPLMSYDYSCWRLTLAAHPSSHFHA